MVSVFLISIRKRLSYESRGNNFELLLLFALAALAIFAWIPNSYYRMVSLPYALIWQSGFWLMAGYVMYRLRKLKIQFNYLGHGLDRPLLALVIVLLLSGFLSMFPALAAQNIVLVLFYIVLLYGLVNTTSSWFRLSLFWSFLVFTGTIVAAISLIHWQPTLDMWFSNDFYAAIRNPFPLGHHNFTGGYFVLILPLAVGAVTVTQGWHKYLSITAFALIAIALYSTGSRGAWLGEILTLFLTLSIILWRSRGSQRRQAILVSIVVCGLAGLILLSNPRIRNFFDTHSFGNNTGTQVVVTDGPAKDRFFMAQAVINILKDRPLLGVGPGNMARVYNFYRPVEAGTGLDQVQQLHNMPLQIIGELGIAGGIVYVWGVVLIAKLWWQTLQSLPLDKRKVGYVIGASFLSYSISSLTDSQLENIPIATTLVILLVMLLLLANDNQPSISVGVPIKARRFFSLCVLGLIALSLQFWPRSNLALYFTQRALNALESSDFVVADQLFSRAAAITPWDPTANALAAQEINRANNTSLPDKTQQTLTELIIQHYKTALQADPNNVWFNHNLAFLYLSTEPQRSTTYISRSLQLLPRRESYRYYLLGLSYLQQEMEQEAITAFALESLVNPHFIGMSIWQQPEFLPMRKRFFQQTLEYYESLLVSVPTTATYYNYLYEQTQLIRWWASLEVNKDLDEQKLRPIVNALLATDTSVEKSLNILNACLQDKPNTESCLLMRAWLQPEPYLDQYFASTEELETEAAVDQVIRHINQFRSARGWLQSVYTDAPIPKISVLALAYRNINANLIHDIFLPVDNIKISAFSQSLELFPVAPREMPEVDRLIETVRGQQLGTPHPTMTGFIPTLPPSGP